MAEQINLKDYEIILKIGEGSSGIVYKARDITDKIVTVKQIKNSSKINENEYKQAMNEINIIKDLNGYENFVDLIDVETDENNLYIIYEYNEYSISDLIHRNFDMTLEQIKFCFKTMLKSIETLNYKGYIHRDIKPDNFLITSKNEIKLIDFSLSVRFDDEFENDKAYMVGTYGYMAPEVLLGSTDCGIEIDIWSLGCTLYELLTHEKLIKVVWDETEIAKQMIEIFGFPTKEDFPLFDTFQNKELFTECRAHQITTLEEILDRKLKDEYKIFKPLLIGMLQMNPKSRLSISEVLEDPIFADTESIENLPQITINECNKRFCAKKKKNRMFDLLEELRPSKISPMMDIIEC